jgi:hypothetical protein
VPRLMRNGVSFPTQNARFINIWRSEGRRTLKKNVMPQFWFKSLGPLFTASAMAIRAGYAPRSSISGSICAGACAKSTPTGI